MLLALAATAPEPDGLTLSWAGKMLTVRGPDLPGKAVEIWYIDAFFRPGSIDRDWHDTVIPHRTIYEGASVKPLPVRSSGRGLHAHPPRRRRRSAWSRPDPSPRRGGGSPTIILRA